jgi:hypothetical protein
MRELVIKGAKTHRILRELYRHVEGRTDAWEDLRRIAIGIQMTPDEAAEAHSSLMDEGLITPYGAGYTAMLTHKGIKYLEFGGVLEDKDIVLNTLKVLKQVTTGHMGVHVIFDYLCVSEDEPFRKDILDFLYEHNLIKRATGDDWFVIITPAGKKLTSSGYDSLLAPQSNTVSGDTIHISGSNHNVILKSPNSSITWKSEDVEKALPQLLDFFQKIRVEDTSLLLAAVQDIKAGKEIEPSKFERIAGFLANMTTIVSAVIPH